MEELFNNILVLVPVALLIFLRVFAEGARKRSEKARKEAASAESTHAVQGTRATSPSGRPQEPARVSRQEMRQSSRKQRREELEAAKPNKPVRRDLLGRLRNYLSGSLDQLGETPEPLHFEEEARRRLGQYTIQTASNPGTKARPSTGYREGLAGAMEESPAIVHKPAAPYTFPKRLERLTPLKRAIVLAEVLGKPKSLQ
jgi:hypothetical protein